MRSIPSFPLALRSGVGGAVGASIQTLNDRYVVLARSGSDRRRGALTLRDGETLAVAAELALSHRIPLVLELASSGADVTEGIDALHGWGGAAAAIAACSGVVPILAAVTGPVVSGPALLLSLTDLVVMTSSAFAFVSGPSMVAEFTGVLVGLAELGGAAVHSALTGVCAIESETPMETIGDLLGFLPQSADEEPPSADSLDPTDRSVPELSAIVPSRATASYDIRHVLEEIVDFGDVCELWAGWAPQIVTAFSRIGGRPIGIVANQPRSLAGTLDVAASQKAARFVRLCDAFNFPILTLVDTPGFLPGKDLEWRGMIRHGAELAFAYAEATVPRVCLILRKAIGGAYIVMDSKGLGNDVCIAWPSAEVAVMGAQGAVQILNRDSDEQRRRELQDDYSERLLTPWVAAERGFIDAVIDPADTRRHIANALEMLSTRRECLVGRKHDCGPM